MRVLAMKKTIDFTQGPITVPVLRFAIPLLLGNLLQQVYSIADTVIVGHLLGSDALAAIGAASPVVRLSIALAIGFTLGVSVVVAQYFGSHQKEMVKRAISTAYLFFVALSILIMVLGVILTPFVLRRMATPDNAFKGALDYLQISFLGTVFMLGYNVSSAVYRGVGNSSLPLYMLLLSTILNVVLDLIFVVVFKMGVGGTAFATVLSQAIAFLFSAIYFEIAYKEYAIFQNRNFCFDKKYLRQIMKIGVPSGLKGAMYWLGYVLIVSLVNSYGVSAIAAFSTASKIDSFIQTPMIALSSSLSTYVGQNVGAKKAERIRQGVLCAIGLGVVFGVIMTVIVLLFAADLMKVFTSDKGVIEMGTAYLRIVASVYLIYILEEIPQGVAIGAGDTLWLLLSTICAMWAVRLPLVYFLSAKFGLVGIWYGMPSGWFVALLFCGGYYFSGFWKKKFK
jgi:putative efflux protein, MATE family